VLAYARDHGDDRVVVMLNFGQKPVSIELADLFEYPPKPPQVWLSTLADRQEQLVGNVVLRGDEGLIAGVGPVPQ
jgi:hypothetical protein